MITVWTSPGKATDEGFYSHSAGGVLRALKPCSLSSPEVAAVHISLFIPMPSLVKALPAFTTIQTLKPATNQRTHIRDTASQSGSLTLRRAAHLFQTQINPPGTFMLPNTHHKQGVHLPLSLFVPSMHERVHCQPRVGVPT